MVITSPNWSDLIPFIEDDAVRAELEDRRRIYRACAHRKSIRKAIPQYRGARRR